MGVLLLSYESDPLVAQAVKRIRDDGLVGFGFHTQMGKATRHGYGEIVSGAVVVGESCRRFSLAVLRRDAGALGAAHEAGCSSGESVLIATATEEQAAILAERRHDLTRGYVVLLRESVPLVGELGNALLVIDRKKIRRRDPGGEIAAAAMRMVFSETYTKKPFAPKRHRSYPNLVFGDL
jgi:hypothetical protein